MPEQPASRPLAQRPGQRRPEIQTLEVRNLAIDRAGGSPDQAADGAEPADPDEARQGEPEQLAEPGDGVVPDPPPLEPPTDPLIIIGEVVEPDAEDPDHDAEALAPALEAVQAWRHALASSGAPDTLLRAGSQADTWLDITHAHPSGLAQLLAGRPTRLSSLVREPGAHIRARRRARAIRAAAADLATERGIRGCYLAAGLATWTVPGAPEGAEPPSAPVLLRGCTLRPRGADDYDLDLDDSAVVNPELVRALSLAADVSIDGAWLGTLAFGREGFDPRPVVEWLEERCSHLPGFRIDRGLVVATFTAGSGAVLADLDAVAVAIPRHDLLSRIAVPDGAEPAGDVGPDARPADRDPADELLVLDLDPAQQAAVDAVVAGGHVTVEGPPGSGVTQVLVAAAGQLAAAGRTVLVVTPRRSTADAFLSRLDAAGLRHLALDLPDGAGGRRRALAELTGSLDGLDAKPEGDPDAERAAMHLRLRRARELLTGTTRAVHQVREPWQVSAHTALARLADLAGPTPATPARLPAPVLARLDTAQRERLRVQLRTAAAAGAFNLTRIETRWLDATVSTYAEAERALQAARAARDGLPVARQAMDQVCDAVGISRGSSVAQWQPRLSLLLGVRATLDAMLPAVYEQSLDALVESIGPGANRRAGGWSRQEWRRTRRHARGLVRPGVHVEDLHGMLQRARAERVRWREMVGGAAPPQVPHGLTDAEAAVDELVRSLAAVRAVLAGPVEDLLALPLPELEKRLLDLAGDEAGILGQPRRSTTLRELRESGLGPLVDDLRARRTGPERIDAELDLAWWSGVLDTAVRGDATLVKHDPARLWAAREELRGADGEHLTDCSARVLKQVANRARHVARQSPEQLHWLRSDADGEHRSAWPGELFRRAGDVVAAVRPIWVLSPDTVARSLPPPELHAGWRPPDVAIIDDAGNVGLPEVVAALARARQVVVGGDRRRLSPPDGMPSVLDAVVRVTGARRLAVDHRARDQRLTAPLHECYPEGWRCTPGVELRGALRLELVEDGTGVPGLGETIAVSPDAEVRRVVELVARHAAERPEQSLLVTTFGDRHAERIEAALRSQASYRPELSRWLAEHWLESGRGEAFGVRSAQRSQGLERDVVIVTVGLAKTPHGRVLHKFGSIDEPHGRAALLGALTRARRSTLLVCCFTAQDLAEERLRSDGARLLQRVLDAAAHAGPPVLPGAEGVPEPDVEVGPEPDAEVGPEPAGGLVADLRKRLVAAGMRVRAGVLDAGWAIDLVVQDEDGRGLVAVDLDGDSYAERGWRERDRQRAERLERAGWAYCLVTGLDLVRDPAAEVDRVREAWLRARREAGR